VKHKVAEKTGVKVTTCNLLVADSTAAVVLQLVNDEVERVQPADILRLTSGARARRAGRRPLAWEGPRAATGACGTQAHSHPHHLILA